MAYDITEADKRKSLAPRPGPYWVKVAGAGKHLGYRRIADGGTWVARIRPLGGERKHQRLGSEDKLDYEAALAKALEWFKTVSDPDPSDVKIKDAISAYLDYLQAERAISTYKGDRSYAMNHILPVSSLGEKLIAEVETTTYDKWLRKVARNLGAGDDDPERRRKAKYSANQCLKVLKAALNRFYRTNKSLPASEWREVEPLKGGASVGRKVFLTGGEPQRLVNCCDGAFRDLVMFGLMTGCRLGEVVNMRVRDLDLDDGLWSVEISKTRNPDKPPRTTVLDDAAVDLLIPLVAGKQKSDLVFQRDDGVTWNKDNVQPPMRAAVKRAKLDKATTYYSLRHTYISAQLKAGAPTQAVAENTGTSVRMIEKHYGKFLPSEKRKLLEPGRIKLEMPSPEPKVVNIH